MDLQKFKQIIKKTVVLNPADKERFLARAERYSPQTLQKMVIAIQKNETELEAECEQKLAYFLEVKQEKSHRHLREIVTAEWQQHAKDEETAEALFN